MSPAALFLLATAPADPGLALFDRLTGNCFAAPVGVGAIDTHCFEEMYRGAHVRDRHEVVVDGKVVYAGETIYSREGASVAFVYVNSLGGVGEGSVRAGDHGPCFVGDIRGTPQSAPAALASCWEWTEAGYIATATAPIAGRAEFVRVAPKRENP